MKKDDCITCQSWRRGGIFIGGGIVPCIGEIFERTAFGQRFKAKGRFTEFLADVPCMSFSPGNHRRFATRQLRWIVHPPQHLMFREKGYTGSQCRRNSRPIVDRLVFTQADRAKETP
jgi:hypothetical protein